MSGGDAGPPPHRGEHHEKGALASRLNWLRAGVLGANDGIVSTAGLVVGVAGASTDRSAVLLAGVAGLVAGALSMAGGEYVSVSAQRDSERAAISLEKWELANLPQQELAELAEFYRRKGLDESLAMRVAEQLTARDALAAHAEVELGIDPDRPVNPWHAAGSSFAAFAIGSLLPLLAIVVPPVSLRVPVTMVAVTLALALTGVVSAGLGRARKAPAVARTVGVGLATMAITFGIGSAIGTVL